MARIPTSHLTGTAGEAFGTVLTFHLPDGGRVLDPTYGTGLSWRGVLSDLEPWLPEVVPSIELVRPCEDIFGLRKAHPDWANTFDLVYYDPPYMIGVAKSDDPRAEAYGGYDITREALKRYMGWAETEALFFLKPGGKLVVKCGDQYLVKERRLLLHHIDWVDAVAAQLDIVDFYIYKFHRVSPTAYQVKDRPSAVVAHSYFIVGQKPHETGVHRD